MENEKERKERSSGSIKSKQESVKRRVDKFTEERKKYSGEKDDDYAERRKKKKARKRRIKRDRKLRILKFLYWPSFGLISCGCVFIFGATIESISGGSVFWVKREEFRIAGPVVLCAGIILFMATVAGVTNHTKRINEINQQEELRRKEERRARRMEIYSKNQEQLNNASPKSQKTLSLNRTTSHTSSLTCHSIEEMDSSYNFENGMMTSSLNGSLHPNWKPMIKKYSTESNASSKWLDCSQSSTSTVMTSLSSYARPVSPCHIAIERDSERTQLPYFFIGNKTLIEEPQVPRNQTDLNETDALVKTNELLPNDTLHALDETGVKLNRTKPKRKNHIRFEETRDTLVEENRSLLSETFAHFIDNAVV